MKSNQEILPDLAHFTLQKQKENHLMVAISRAWYNGLDCPLSQSNTCMELRYTISSY